MTTLWDELVVYGQHVTAMFRPGAIGSTHPADRNKPGDLAGWSSDDRELLVEEGRRQLDRQGNEIERIRTRAQVLFAIAIALLGGAGGLAGKVDSVGSIVLWGVWGAAIVVGAWATLGAAAVVTVAAQIETIHATVLSRSQSPVEPRLASDYAVAVVAGENALAVRLTNFRWSVSFLLISAALAFVALAWTQYAGQRPLSEASRSHSVLQTTTSTAPTPPAPHE